MRLFDRIGKNVSITQYGKNFISYARDIVSAVARAQVFASEETELTGMVQVGTLNSLMTASFSDIVPAFRQRFPHVMMRLHADMVASLKDKLLKNELDLIYTLDSQTIVESGDGQEALDIALKQPFDVLIIDWMLPHVSGIEIVQKLRIQHVDSVMIMLTARDDETDILYAFDQGVDDYVTKPFRIKELLSRIKSVLRRYQKDALDIVQIQHLEIHIREGKVYREGSEVFLTALEYRLLMVFVNHQGQVLSRSQLLEGIWDVAGDFVNDNTLSVYIKRLREKLEKDAAEPEIIKTIRGRGYRMEKGS